MGYSPWGCRVGHDWATSLHLRGKYKSYPYVGFFSGPSWVAQAVKNLPAIQETEVWSLVWENPLEKEMAAHSSILAWRIPLAEEPRGLQSVTESWTQVKWLSCNISVFSSCRNFFQRPIYVFLGQRPTSPSPGRNSVLYSLVALGRGGGGREIHNNSC